MVLIAQQLWLDTLEINGLIVVFRVWFPFNYVVLPTLSLIYYICRRAKSTFVKRD